MSLKDFGSGPAGEAADAAVGAGTQLHPRLRACVAANPILPPQKYQGGACCTYLTSGYKYTVIFLSCTPCQRSAPRTRCHSWGHPKGFGGGVPCHLKAPMRGRTGLEGVRDPQQHPGGGSSHPMHRFVSQPFCAQTPLCIPPAPSAFNPRAPFIPPSSPSLTCASRDLGTIPHGPPALVLPVPRPVHTGEQEKSGGGRSSPSILGSQGPRFSSFLSPA